MTPRHCVLALGCLALLTLPLRAAPADGPPDDRFVEMPLDTLADKIQGGLLGQILGNLNGLPHEFQYAAEPGRVNTYVPALPDGARTDDDTDIEWLYVVEMQRTGRVLLPPERIVELWRRHVNDHVWCANLYARSLMDLGFEPPLTGRNLLNPWSDFNISGQFLSEAFGLLSPAMPQTAARTGLHYTHVGIEGEPAQATQLFAGMIATAFIEHDVERIVEAGMSNIDPQSATCRVVQDVRRWQQAAPDDWMQTRRLIRDRYTRHSGGMRDVNGFELNTAAVIGALLHGNGDFVETLRLAFNFGWDADCNAATAGTIVGVIRGHEWMREQGWVIADRYQNTTRPGMPADETISGYGRRLVALARQQVEENGGGMREVDGRKVLRIRCQPPGCVEKLPNAGSTADLERRLMQRIDQDLDGTPQSRARAAYIGLCLEAADPLISRRPGEWAQAIEALKNHPVMLKRIAEAPPPGGIRLRQRAAEAGLPLTRSAP